MKKTGIVRKTDNLGRIVIPIELRKHLDIGLQDPLEISVDGDSICLKKYYPACSLCNNIHEKYKYFKGKPLCQNCLDEIR